jgi:hypothetical protein
MADTPTLVGAIAAGATAIASAITTVYKSVDVETKLAKLETRLQALEPLPAAIAETRSFVQGQIDAFARRLKAAERGGSQPAIDATLIERLAAVEAWVAEKRAEEEAAERQAEAEERRAERAKMAELLAEVKRLTSAKDGSQ